MNGPLDLLGFAGVMVMGQFSPGPDMILLTRTALKQGVRAGVEMALGIACGLTIHATVAVAGLAMAFERVPALRELMRWAAAGYLLWLGYRMFVEIFVTWYSGVQKDGVVEESGRRPFLRGFFCNLLNPKAAIFLAAVTAPFLRGERPEWWAFAIWSIIVGQAFVLWSLWAWLLQWQRLRLRYERLERWIDGAFGVALIALAVRLIIG